MKKQFYLSASLSCLLLSVATARSWTSADGGKSFEADFKSFDEERGDIYVTKSGKTKKFKTSFLSETDQQWVTAKVKELKNENIAEALAEQKIGKKLSSSSVLSRFEGEGFASASLEKVPEFYILYFTASW